MSYSLGFGQWESGGGNFGMPGYSSFGAPGGSKGGSGSGGGKASEQQSSSQQQSSSGQYFDNPAIAGSVSSNLGNLINKNSESYNQFVSDPAGHPAFTNALQGMLAALVPSEKLGERNLNDVYRAAGNTASSTFGKAAAGYQSDMQRNRMELASNLLTKLYPQIASAMYAPIGQSSQLLDALKMNQSSSSGNSSSSGYSNFPPVQPQGQSLSMSGGGGVSSIGSGGMSNGYVPNSPRGGWSGGQGGVGLPMSTQNVSSGMPDFGGGGNYSGSDGGGFGSGGLDWSTGQSSNIPDVSNWDFSVL